MFAGARGQMDGDIICEVERGVVPMQTRADTPSYLLIALVALVLVSAGVLTAIVL